MDLSREPTSVDGRGIEATADWRTLKSGENYVGYERTENSRRRVARLSTSHACTRCPCGYA